MTIKTSLMLMAATLAPLPLYAQQPDTAPAAITAPAAPSAAAARAAVLAPLSIMPADVDAAIIIRHLPAFLHHGGDCPVDSIAIGLGKGSAASIQSFIRMLHFGFAGEIRTNLLEDFLPAIRTEFIDSFLALKPATDVDVEGFRYTAADVKIRPVYACATAAKGQEEAFHAALTEMVEELKAAVADNENIIFEENGNVVHITITGAAAAASYSPDSDWQSKILRAEIGSRTLHFTITRGESQALFILCENPEEAVTAPTPEQSVLGTDQWAAVDSVLADDILIAASAAPWLRNAAFSIIRDFAPTILAPLPGIFQDLEGKAAGTPDAEVFKGAAEGSKELISAIVQLIPTVEKPSFMQVWKSEDGYHAEFSADSLGLEYEPAKLMHAAKADDPNTIYYAEMTPLTIKGGASLESLTTAAGKVLDGFGGLITPEDKQEIAEDWNEVAPVADAIRDSLGSIISGLGSGTVAFVVDNRATAPQWLMDRDNVSLPRVAFYSGVSDRSKLAEGWDGLLSTARTVCELMDEDPSTIDMLPIVPSKAGDATSYTVALPVFTPDMCPNVTVSDTAFAIGSSAKLNRELANATGTQEFAGAVFSLRLAPLADMVGTWTETDDEDDVMAATLRSAASQVETVSGTSTIKDGVHTLRIDVKFNKQPAGK